MSLLYLSACTSHLLQFAFQAHKRLANSFSRVLGCFQTKFVEVLIETYQTRDVFKVHLRSFTQGLHPSCSICCFVAGFSGPFTNIHHLGPLKLNQRGLPCLNQKVMENYASLSDQAASFVSCMASRMRALQDLPLFLRIPRVSSIIT